MSKELTGCEIIDARTDIQQAIARFDKLEKAVCELQDLISHWKKWRFTEDLIINNPIQPAEEPVMIPDEKCSRCKFDCDVALRSSKYCHREPKEDKKYYCLCGAELRIIQNSDGWRYLCGERFTTHTSHYVLDCPCESEAELIEQLEKLPKKG